MACSAGAAAAQGAPPPLDDLVIRLTAMTGVTGLEQKAIDTLLSLVPGSRRDRAGNAVLSLGTGASKRLAVCPVDEPGYVVGQVRSDGYLTLRRSPGAWPRERDAQLEGQRVTVWTRKGPMPGVVAVRSIHLTRGRDPVARRFTVDSALVDVGVASETEAAALGLQPLAPVTLLKRPHRYGQRLVAAPGIGRRAACAALVAAARRAAPDQGRISRRRSMVIAFVVEHHLSSRGLATIANSMGPFEETLLLDEDAGSAAVVAERWPSLGRVTMKSLPVKYGGTAVETLSLPDADRLAGEIAAWLGASR